MLNTPLPPNPTLTTMPQISTVLENNAKKEENAVKLQKVAYTFRSL